MKKTPETQWDIYADMNEDVFGPGLHPEPVIDRFGLPDWMHFAPGRMTDFLDIYESESAHPSDEEKQSLMTLTINSWDETPSEEDREAVWPRMLKLLQQDKIIHRVRIALFSNACLSKDYHRPVTLEMLAPPEEFDTKDSLVSARLRAAFPEIVLEFLNEQADLTEM